MEDATKTDIEEESKDKRESPAKLSPQIEQYFNEWSANPKSKVFAKLADEYRKCGLLDEALNVCEEGLKENPNYLSGNMVLAKVYFDKGEYDRSFQEAKKVANIQNDNIMAQNLLLKLYIKKGDKDSAVKTCDVISFLDPGNEEIIERKKILEQEGIRPEDISDVKEDAAADKEEDDTRSNIDNEQADDEHENEFATNTIADLYVKQGFYEKGLNIYRQMLEDSPGDEKIIGKINEIERLMGNKSDEKNDAAVEDNIEYADENEDKTDGAVEEVSGKIEKLGRWLERIKNRSSK